MLVQLTVDHYALFKTPLPRTAFATAVAAATLILHLKSRWHDDGVHIVGEHLPDPMHCGWPDLVYGGLIAMLVDCHSNWAVMAYRCSKEG